MKEEIFTDHEGMEYRLVEKTREIPRRTYIKAHLNGKYWGEMDKEYSDQFRNSKFYDFNIYEVTLKNATYSSSPILLKQDLRIPRERLPKLLHTILQTNGKEYEVDLHDPIFANIQFDRKLHQDDGNEIFGTIDAIVAGYILDFIKEKYLEKEYLLLRDESDEHFHNEMSSYAPISAPTGNVERSGNYKRTEYYYSDYKNTYWSQWKYTKSPNDSNNEGCFTFVIDFMTGVLGIAFILMVLPQLAIIFPFFLVFSFLRLIPSRFFLWIFQIIGFLIFLGFVIGLLQFFKNTTTTYIPKPAISDSPEEQKALSEPIIDTLENNVVNDTLIKHFRVWQDYEGNQFKGTVWTKKSDFKKANYYKKSLVSNSNSKNAYDEIIYLLKENDKNNLNGLYQLFDQIAEKEQFSNLKFAEIIVSFVQDIPYVVVVPDDCNPNSYEDKFIKEYLLSEDARCDGFEKFGINSPIEFMSTLNGDCDTRTLLLFTILSHYGYDVALLSSEYYGHSLIGINLPISGMSFQFQNQRYVLWETTAPKIKAGVIPEEISNLNYWRISLKSK